MKYKLPSPTSRWLIAAPFMLGFALLALLVLNRPGSERQVDQEAVRTLRVIRAPSVNVVPRILGYGTAQPGQVWRAVSEVKGWVTDVHPELKSGAMLRQGEVVLRINPTEYQLAIARIEADLARATAQLEELATSEANDQASLEIEEASLALAQRDLQRGETLLSRDAISEAEVDRQKRNLLAQRQGVQQLKNSLRLIPKKRKTLEATLAAKKAELRQAELDKAKTVITAPLDCRVGDVAIEPGQYLAAGQELFEAHGTASTEIAVQVPLDQLRILIHPERSFPLPVTMDAATIETLFDFEVVIRLRTGDFEAAWEGRVVRMREQLDPRTRTVALVVAVDEPYEQAIPGRRPPLVQGMYCEAELRGAVRQARIVVPRSALHDGHVYIVDNDSRLRRRKVETAFAQSGFVCLNAGLNEGETLVVSDPTPAIDGLLARPVVDEDVEQRLIAEATAEGSLK